MYKIFVIAIIFLINASCSQWRINEIKSKKIAEIKNGSEPGEIQILRDEYALSELSFSINVSGDKIITTDNTLKRVQVLDKDGAAELVIGNTDKVDKNQIKATDFKFSIIGSCIMDEKGNLYVQNRLESKKSRRFAGKNRSFLPSYILVFNKDGQLQYTMGKTGSPDLPFFYIENLFLDNNGRLFVISRTFNTWELYRFNKRKQEKFKDFSTLTFKENDGNDTYTGKIENIKIYRNGESVLLSVAYYHGIRFKFRKVYEYSLEENKIAREITTIPDPKNVLFNIVDDKSIYFWNIDGPEVKFMIINSEGNIMNNIKLTFDNRNYFTRVNHDENGNIYSYHVGDNNINILEWE